MKGKRHAVEQKIRILREADQGDQTILDVCREHNISEVTFHRWKNQFGQMDVNEARRLKELERETDHWERATRIEDKALAVFGFANDAQAMIVSDLTPVRWQGARIYGSEGMIEMTTDDLYLMNGNTSGWAHHKPDGEFFKYGADRFEWVEGGAGQARELADWVTGKTDYHRGNGASGYKALEMVHAVYESARLHVQVQMPMKTMVNPLDVMIDAGHLPVRYPGKHDIRASHLRGENLGADTGNQ